jgi:hypothetical protein
MATDALLAMHFAARHTNVLFRDLQLGFRYRNFWHCPGAFVGNLEDYL